MNAKRILGLTGNFGSGKSTVAAMFKMLGAEQIDADQIVHEGMAGGGAIYERVAALFPEARSAGTGADARTDLDRKKIAAIVFRDPARREQLEAVAHPYVFQRIGEIAAASKKPLIVVEVPLLFESGFDASCDKTLVVDAPEAVIQERLKARGFSTAEVKARLASQMPRSEKIKRADYVIDNSKSIETTTREVKRIWKDLAASL